MHDGVHPFEEVRAGTVRVPLALPGVRRRVPHQADHGMAPGGQESRQGRTDKSRRPGHGHRHRGRPPGPRSGMRGQVTGQLAMAKGEHGPQQGGRDRRAHLVLDPRGNVSGLAEAMSVLPTEQGKRHGRHFVHEGVRRVVSVAPVLGYPTQPARERQYRLPVPQRGRLTDNFPGQPGRRKAGQSARPGVPGEDLGQRCLHDAAERGSHPRDARAPAHAAPRARHARGRTAGPGPVGPAPCGPVIPTAAAPAL